MYEVLVLFVFVGFLSTVRCDGIRQCWNVTSEGCHHAKAPPSLDCEELELGEYYVKKYKHNNMYNVDFFIGRCVRCDFNKAGKGITCDLLSVIPTPKYMMIPYRGLVFLYVKIPDRKLLTLHFLHTENRRKVDNGIRVQGPINGRVGPFFVNTYYMPIELTSLRCLTIDNIECKVEFLEREAFSLLHYVPKPKDPIYW